MAVLAKVMYLFLDAVSEMNRNPYYSGGVWAADRITSGLLLLLIFDTKQLNKSRRF